MRLPLFVWTWVSAWIPNWLRNNLVSYYKMDTNGSFPDAHWSNNGTINGATFTASGKINWGYDFDWINDDVISSTSIWAWNKTVSFWIRWTNNSSTADIRQSLKLLDAAWDDENIAFSYNHVATTFQSAFNVKNTLNQFFPAKLSTPLLWNNWYFIIWVIDWTNLKAYCNWALEDTTPFTGTLNNPDTMLIWKWWVSSAYYDWLLDELWIWDKALSQTEITDLYNSWAWLSYDNFTI